MTAAKQDAHSPNGKMRAKCSHGTPFGYVCAACRDCEHGVWHGAQFCEICNPNRSETAPKP